MLFGEMKKKIKFKQCKRKKHVSTEDSKKGTLPMYEPLALDPFNQST